MGPDRPRRRLTRRRFLRNALAAAPAVGLLRLPGLTAPAAAADGPAAPAVYPDDAFSRPPADRLGCFATLAGCAPFCDVETRVTRWTENRVRLSDEHGRTVIAWRFRAPAEGQAVLLLEERIRRRPEAFELRARNAGPEPVTLWLEAHEMPWQPVRENKALPWRIGAPQPLAPGEERVVEFPFAKVGWPGRAEPATPVYPLGALLLLAQGLKPDVPNELVLSEATVRYPPADGVRVAALDCPPALQAGRTVALTVRAAGLLTDRVIDLELRREPRVLWRIRLTAEERQALAAGACTVRRTVPWHLPAGAVTLGLVADGYRAAGAEAQTRLVNGLQPRLPKAERRLHHGRPSFFVDGRPCVWQGYSSYDYQPGNVAEFGASGSTVLCVPACAGRHMFQVAAPTWTAPERWDFDELEERVAFSLQANPDAVLFLRVALAMPAFWCQAHESELARIQTGAGSLVWEEMNSTPAPSLASAAWREAQGQALRALVRHCKAQPWASRLAGFWLTGEVTEEWFAWGCNDGRYADYSRPNQVRFALWLAERGLPVPAGDSPIPLPEVRHRSGYDVYPDEPGARLAAAYHQYTSDLTAEAIGHFARIVKEETAGRSLVGTFYGYLIQLAGEPRQAISGHFAVRRLLDDPHVDFLAGVPLLDFRELGNGASAYSGATESVLAAGKLYCNENDLFSWLHPILWHVEYDPADPRAAAIAMHPRECANDCVHGAVAQKFSLMASWHHDAALHADFARQTAVYARAQSFDRTAAEQIAFVVDDTSFAWTPPESTLLNAAHKRLLYHLMRTGAPVGVWLLSDLHRLPERVRLVVVAGAPAALPADLAPLSAMLRAGGRTVWVIGPAGLVDPLTHHWQPDAPAALLGLPIRVEDAALPGVASLVADGTPVSTLATLRPRARLDGDGFLRYSDGPAAGGERALAHGGRLLWCGVPPLNTPLLRRWVEQAGVHCYAPAECFVHASRELVSVTAAAGGSLPLRWPRGVVVEDLFDGWRGAGKQMDCPFATGQTRLFAVRKG